MAHRTHEWLTVPNVLTVARLGLLVPLTSMILAGQGGYWPLILIMAWAGSDWLDGFIARGFGQTSRVGEILDPIADRLGIFVVTLSLCISGTLSWLVPVVIGATDAGATLFAGRAAASGRIQVNMLGKVRSAVLFLGVVLLVASASLASGLGVPAAILIGVGTVLHVIAGISYIHQARRAARQETVSASQR